MKATLIFNLPEEQDEFEMAQQGWKYRSILDDFRSWLRSQSKHGDKYEFTIDELREKLSEIEGEYFD
jgi:hypothetical protein